MSVSFIIRSNRFILKALYPSDLFRWKYGFKIVAPNGRSRTTYQIQRQLSTRTLLPQKEDKRTPNHAPQVHRLIRQYPPPTCTTTRLPKQPSIMDTIRIILDPARRNTTPTIRPLPRRLRQSTNRNCRGKRRSSRLNRQQQRPRICRTTTPSSQWWLVTSFL